MTTRGTKTANTPSLVTTNECNHESSWSEKDRQRLFKKHLKQQNDLRKLETQVHQSILRNDKPSEDRARNDWDDYYRRLQNDQYSLWNYVPPTTGSNSSSGSILCQLNQESRFRHLHRSLRYERDTAIVREGKTWLLDFYRKLAVSMLPTIRGSDKEEQTLRAAELKANMHKGTQTESMFDDELALLGYTRQKFYERAVLAFESLDRLDPTNRDASYNNEAVDGAWKRLTSTQQVVSIGSGPGCDATGVMGFFRSHGIVLEHGILLMDFVMDRWKDLVLDKLIPMMVPEYVPVVKAIHCDIRRALMIDDDSDDDSSESPNHRALSELTRDFSSDHRLVVVSYLLTETRFRWKAFFRDLLSMLQGTESLLLLTEPTAWQLQEFLECFGSEEHNLLRAHVWLDSSRDVPHLQTLDKRNGPAILLVCTH